ncbi:hypothetical protein HYW20_03425 [Candidatus Woesearchaeota archaeon]|nr:hypothetical protein [Candidatus Woesearchaeota archaeon]
MAIITISVKDDVDKEFRETVKKKLGQGKGVLGKAVEEALKKWVRDETQEEIARRAMEMMDKGLYSLPKGWKFNREEIYDRGL